MTKFHCRKTRLTRDNNAKIPAVNLPCYLLRGLGLYMSDDIRWKQRFNHYTNALNWLKKSVNRDDLDFMQQAGSIQFFEMCCELAWKLMKDYLEEQGFTEVASPRAAIKQAFNFGLIIDGHAWLQLLSDRNLSAHVYDEETADRIYQMVSDKYYPLFEQLFNKFTELKNHG